ncbi:MAG: DUF1571 domain-containing protein [Phycisphaerales bacterium]|nr:MAG: DUF1571 domain-containing protein [Phycisphaerales bacterium]
MLRTVACTCIIAFGAVGCRITAFDRPIVAQSPDGAVQPARDPAATKRLAMTDPLGFLRMCRENYLAWVSDYRCDFAIREHVAEVLSEEEHIEVLFRQEPFSVHMRWRGESRPAHRLSYVAGRWNVDGQEYALVVPSGVLRWLAPAGVKQDIHSPLMRAASTRPVDQFGFLNTLDFIINYCESARDDPAYDLSYVDIDVVDNRPCYVFERRLPYTGTDGPYPNRLLVLYIDAEWLVPTTCLAYADDAAQELLGSYITTSAQFNVGLTDEDF